MKDRIHWIDVARGIGMLLVIYGHTIDDHQYRYLIYAFHMPFFFFLSGMVFRPAPFWHFLKRSAQTLLLPYFFLAAATYGIGHFTDPNPLTWTRFVNDLGGVLYGNGANGGLGYNVILWFLPCLFVTRLLYWGIDAIQPHPNLLLKGEGISLSSWERVGVRSIKPIFLFFFSILGFFYYHLLPNTYLPFGLETALSAVVFFGAGSLLMQQENPMSFWLVQNLQKHFGKLILPTILLWVIATQVNFQLFGNQIDMRIGHLNNYVLFYMGAFAGILMTVMISMKINANRILEYIGQHTLALLGWQFLGFLYLNNLYNAYLPAALNQLLRLPILVTVVTTAGILGSGYVFFLVIHAVKTRFNGR